MGSTQDLGVRLLNKSSRCEGTAECPLLWQSGHSYEMTRASQSRFVDLTNGGSRRASELATRIVSRVAIVVGRMDYGVRRLFDP
jgi:hypothetical protein